MRKPKLTYKMVEQAIEMKSHGMSNADICRGLGVSETAWYKWLKDPDSKVKVALVEGIKKAEAEYKETLPQSIMATATREKNPQWTAAAWLLERKYPDEYGKAERQRDDAKADAAPRIVLGVVAQPVQEKLPGFDGEGRSDG